MPARQCIGPCSQVKFVDITPLWALPVELLASTVVHFLCTLHDTVCLLCTHCVKGHTHFHPGWCYLNHLVFPRRHSAVNEHPLHSLLVFLLPPSLFALFLSPFSLLLTSVIRLKRLLQPYISVPAGGAEPFLVDLAADTGRNITLRLSDKSCVELPISLDLDAALQKLAAVCSSSSSTTGSGQVGEGVCGVGQALCACVDA